MPPKGSKPRNTQGLVNPGNRVSKRKSNHSLHEQQANGTADRDPPPPPPPPVAASQNSASTNGSIVDPAKGGDSSHATDKPVANCSSEPLLRDPPSTIHFPPAPLTMEINKHASGIKTATAMKQLSVAATTILTSCPQRDVIAMLILLLQLSSPVLFAVDFLFAVMTAYVPRPSSSSLLMPNFQGLFEGAGGAPSMATVVLIDVIFFGLWMFMPVSVKNVGLDLAQAVIALSFSGAASSKNGTTNSAVICLTTIFLFRTLSHGPTRQYGMQILWTKLLRQPDRLKEPPDGSGAGAFVSLNTPSLPRTIVGVHILAQGVLRVIRRSVLAARDASPQISSAPKKTDPEAALFAQLPRSNSLSADKGSDGASGSPTEGRAPGPLPASNEALDRALAGKKKKKQATFVRSQQPFWAALAHTKVTVSNNMEQNHLAGDANEAHATDINHIGNVNFHADADRVWITHLGATEIGFGIALSDEDISKSRDESERSDSLDKSAPFYVRLNGANWSSTRFHEAEGAAREGGEQVHVWIGEVFGLTALCNYVCEFVRMSDDFLVYKTSLITQPAPYAEQAPAPTHQALRPSSPTTTLKNSIAAAEAKLQDQRGKLKRNRRDHKTQTTAVKKEVDRLSSGLATAGGQDERLKQRAMQLKQTIKQAEDATATAEAEAKDLGEIPEDELDEHRARKRTWQKQLDIQNAKRSEIDAAKAHCARECSHVEAEIASAVQKRERLQLRQAKLNEQHDRLVSANAQDADAKQRRLVDRQIQAMTRANLERQYIDAINGYDAKTQEFRARTVQTIAQSQHLEALILQQAQIPGHSQQTQYSTPTTPEGPLPGTGGGSGSAGNRNSYPPFNSTFQFPAFDTSFPDPHTITSAPLSGGFVATKRGRSSSMLSGVSGFTDDLDDQLVPSVPVAPIGSGYNSGWSGVNGNSYIHSNGSGFPYALNGRKSSGGGSSSSGSGSASASGSQKDPMSPPQKVLSPIAKPLSPGQLRH